MAVDPNELYDQLMRQNAAEQDIQAIAKQISDHAEAIYQTWKSKGLTPNELLHLHSSTGEAVPSSKSAPESQPSTSSAPDASFGRQYQSMSSRSSSISAAGRMHGTTPPSNRPKSGSSLSPVELLASPQLEATLEELVNSFVQEDKARLAARSRTASPGPSTNHVSSPIQSALKRLEKKGVNEPSRRQSPSPQVLPTTVEVAPATRSPPSTFQEAVQSASRPSPPLETLDTVKSRAKRFASRIELANSISGSSPSWQVNKRTTSSSTTTTTMTASTVTTELKRQVAAAPIVAVSSSTEVDREEERLINALKTGQVINQVSTSPTSTTKHFLMAKKGRERQQQQQQHLQQQQQQQKQQQQQQEQQQQKQQQQQQQQHQQQHQQRQQQQQQQRTSNGTEEELASLVDRLRESQSNRSTVSTSSRENSPALLVLRDGSPSRSTSPRSVKLSETVPVAGVSTVDYAKVRFQTAQANPLTQQRLEDSRTIGGKAPNTPQPNVVSETRSRFEGTRQPSSTHTSRGGTPINSSTVPWRASEGGFAGRSSVRPSADALLSYVNSESSIMTSQQQSGGLNLDSLRRMKARKMRKSPEPQSQCNTSPTNSPLPHPELTVQQRQHLRDRINLQDISASVNGGSGSGSAQLYTSSGIPIRPFLTRGSVAERVLIFEKCPAAVAASSPFNNTAAWHPTSEKVMIPGATGTIASVTSSSTTSSSSSTFATSNEMSSSKTKRAGSPAPQNWRHSSPSDAIHHHQPNRLQVSSLYFPVLLLYSTAILKKAKK